MVWTFHENRAQSIYVKVVKPIMHNTEVGILRKEELQTYRGLHHLSRMAPKTAVELFEHVCGTKSMLGGP